MISAQARRTAHVVSRQLAAMGSERFCIGVRCEATSMMLPARIWTASEITSPKILSWLMHMNAGSRHGQPASPSHIYLQPADELCNLTLLDDLTERWIHLMIAVGFEPAVVVETSPGNFQAWLKHDRYLPHEQASRIAKILAQRFRADPSSAAARHYGRLAHFTNPKPKYRDASGRFPFVRLIDASGRIYSAATGTLDQILNEATAANPSANTPDADLIQPPKSTRPQIQNTLMPIERFHRNPKYLGDLHRADMAFAIHAAAMGASVSWIAHRIQDARDLSKKGSPARQVAYANRTATKAAKQLPTVPRFVPNHK